MTQAISQPSFTAESDLVFAAGLGHGEDQAALRATERARQLMKITAAIAEAVDAEQVLEAVVDRSAVALNATSGALWLVSPDGETLALARSIGVSEAVARGLDTARLDRASAFPALDATRRKAPLWIASAHELCQHYPELALASADAGACAIACLPLVFEEQARGCLAFSFDDERLRDAAERDFLLLVARFGGQALERLRLLENERALRAANEQARVRAEVLYSLAAGVISAKTVDAVFDAALDGIQRALGASRCAILAFDADHVMRFKAWRGLSERYRRAVEGHSPWSRDEPSPKTLVVRDALVEPNLAAYSSLFESERIGALGFIPICSEGRLIGKFMVYYPAPRELSATEIGMAEAIANHVAAVMGRFAALRELEQAVRYNELFMGMLGHDLRNPLGAIMTAAQLAAGRGDAGTLEKPLARIIRSGERMTAMIDQLLDFTRVRVGGGIPIEPRPADLGQILRQAVDELRDSYAHFSFTVREPVGSTAGEWDVGRVLQVFSNLVANAAQHGDAEHGVSVGIDASAPDSITVTIRNMGTVPSELLPYLFEPMAAGSSRRNQSGLGLGLYISREIVSAHGGSIDVSSSPEAGTTFAVRLPRVARSAQA